MMRNEAADRRPPVPFSSLPDLLHHHAKHIPDAPAILAPERTPLSYGRLHRHLQKTARSLRALGISRGDRVAIVLPNGPELPVAILAVAASATCAPMNPAYQSDDVERYFADLRLDALITQAAMDSPARRVALSRGVPVIDLSPALDSEAGLFTLSGGHEDRAPDQSSRPDHVAVLLTTSGTTSRPKIVPQTHANICAGAFSNVAALNLTKDDRCLNVLPLFHGHGLDATVITSLAAGASVVCTPGLDTKQFCTWLIDFQATWYSAVPTMHQAILAQATQIRERKADCRLRFVRSSAAPLPPQLFKELEQTFATPIIEFYSMAELAGAPIACNPLPPRRQKPGSVGIRVGLDVTIRDDGGDLLPSGHTGHVIVRGPGLVAGYDGNPDATRDAFTDGWFKTGDVGFFDEEGYLFLTGRSREMINRGGEKIAPRQIDEVLLEHPAVAEAVAFAVPHPTLGEDVGAAVVLRPRVKATAKDIREYAKQRLATFKVPQQVQIVAEIPKGPTGKVQRVGLAAKLGVRADTALPQAKMSPRTPLEKTLAGIWAEVLEVEQVGPGDNFFALGGDSLRATRALIRLQEIMHAEVGISDIFEAPTIAELAERIETSLHAAAAPETQNLSAIRPVSRPNGVAAASFAQERLWELQRLLPGLPFFNVLYALRVTSPCDVTVLERSINEIVRRHEILRTTFTAVDGRCVQAIAPDLSVPLTFEDLRALSPPQIEAAVRERVQKELSHSFVLDRGPLIRTRLLRLAKHSHLLLVAMPGLIEDGWSLGILVSELATLYDAFSAGGASPLAPLPIQYADFADWQQHWRSHPDLAAQLTYWEEQLHEPLPVLKLTKARRRRKIDHSTTALRPVALPAKLSEAARDFGHREGVTLFMTLMAAFKIVLRCYSGVDDLRVATDVANRSRPGTEGLFGPVANTVILRTSLHGDPSAREVVRQVRATSLAALANQDIPFDVVAEALERDRGINPATLAQAKLSLQGTSLRAVPNSDHGLSLEEVVPGMVLPVVTMTTFDVTVILRETTTGLGGTCVYKPHLFGAEAIDRLLQDFQQVLKSMVAQPEQPISAMVACSNRRN